MAPSRAEALSAFARTAGPFRPGLPAPTGTYPSFGGRPPLSFPDREGGLFADREFRGRTRTRAGWRAIRLKRHGAARVLESRGAVAFGPRVRSTARTSLNSDERETGLLSLKAERAIAVLLGHIQLADAV